MHRPFTAERIRRAVGNYEIDWGGERLKATLSAGVAAATKGDLMDMLELLGEADEHLTKACDLGGNQVRSPTSY